jgi:hypothetical protein
VTGEFSTIPVRLRLSDHLGNRTLKPLLLVLPLGKKLAGRWAFAESDINFIIEMGSNKAPTIDDYVSKILAGAPPLSEEQRVLLAELLRGVE